jgi:hypothetical protein
MMIIFFFYSFIAIDERNNEINEINEIKSQKTPQKRYVPQFVSTSRLSSNDCVREEVEEVRGGKKKC